jgi:hypothetical protein
VSLMKSSKFPNWMTFIYADISSALVWFRQYKIEKYQH